METKTCTSCNQSLPLSQYYVVKKTGYVYTQCRRCHYLNYTKDIAKEWRKNNKERNAKLVSKAMKKYYNSQDKGVYCIFTDKGLYVGKSLHVTHRINMHKSTNWPGNVKDKGAQYIRHVILAYDDDDKKLLELEKYWIKRLKPELNKEHNPDWKKDGKNGKYIKV